MSERYEVRHADLCVGVWDTRDKRTVSWHITPESAEAEAARLNAAAGKRATRFLPCPFCGKPPKHGPGKKQFCQLHGEPFQHYIVWCDGHARIERPDKADALRQWNARVRIKETGDE